MRRLILFSLFFLYVVVPAKESPRVENLKGPASVRSLEIKRVRSGGPDEAPDGVVLRFLVTRRDGAGGKFATRETKDALIDGSSYAETTRAALGKTFEPKTRLDSAPMFFRTYPHLAPPGWAQAKDDGSMVMSITLLGAPLPSEKGIEIVLHVGFGSKVDDYPFTLQVPAR